MITPAFRKILVGYDDSDEAKDALAFGSLLAELTGADPVVAGILPQDPLTGGRDVLFAESDAEMQRALERAAERTGAAAITTPADSAAHGLHRLGEDLGADLIVVGSSHRGRVGRALAGTVAQRLFHGASCAVVMVPQGYREMERTLREVAVAYDGGPESVGALGAAVAIAQRADVSVQLLTVVYPPALGELGVSGYPTTAYVQALKDHYAEEQAAALGSIPAGVKAEGKLLGEEIMEVVPALLGEVEQGTDLLCVGSRAYGPLRRVLLGSVSTKLTQDTPCPLLVVPRGAHEERASQQEIGATTTAR